MDFQNGEKQIAIGKDDQPAKECRDCLSQEAFKHAAGQKPDSDDINQTAKFIVGVVNENGDFGKSGGYGPKDDRDYVKQILQQAHDDNYLDELTRDLNLQMINQGSDLRFDIDKHTYYFTSTDSKNPKLYTVEWDKLNLGHNGSKDVDVVGVRTQVDEKLPPKGKSS